MSLKKIFSLILFSLFTLTSCGKQDALEYPGGQQRPKFDKVSDELSDEERKKYFPDVKKKGSRQNTKSVTKKTTQKKEAKN